MEGTILDYVSLLESDSMHSEAQKLGIKAAKKAGYTGKIRKIILRDLTAASENELPLIPSPSTGQKGDLGRPRNFNLMFSTNVGALVDDSTTAYLRPETAQGIFANFANVQRTSRMKVTGSVFIAGNSSY
jgi:glycyl-tRNA synthetase